MSKILTTNKLVTTIKRRAMLPTDQSTFSKQDIIDIANEEVDEGLTPHILSVHDEYLVNYIDIPIVSSQDEYPIPYRAIGNKLRAAKLINENGDAADLTRVELDDLSEFDNDYEFGYPSSFYIRNNKLVLLNSSLTSASKIRMYFYMRISELVEDKYAAVITNIDTATGQVTVDKIPYTFATDVKYDITMAKTPNKLLSYDLEPTSLNTTSKIFTFDTEDLPSELQVGYYITLAEQTIVPQVPVELHPLLAQRVAVACLEALGDAAGIQLAAAKLQNMEEKTLQLIDNRVEGSPQKINGRYSPLKQRLSRYGRNTR